MTKPTKVRADPTKAFFVRMLTRDITLDDCILDLIDNSIDGAWKISGEHPSGLIADSALEDFRIDITLSEESFRIADNCGGISFDNAVKYAFTFGRDETIEEDGNSALDYAGDYAVGVYGIGMKRAVFKLGNTIRINSTYAVSGDGELESFVVPIDVAKWLRPESGWDFDIDPRDPDAAAGVTIEVEDLLEEPKSQLKDPTYEKALRRIIARDYMLPLMRGLTIAVNGRPVDGWKFILKQNENFSPMRDSYTDGSVDVEIVAGMMTPPPNDGTADQSDKAPDLSGWYVLCNGRVVLAADKTEVTGWGGPGQRKFPKWHSQYSGFGGLVHFSSKDPSLLPMTTTKRSVDVSSAVFARAVPRLQKPARVWIDYTYVRRNNSEETEALEKKAEPVQLTEVVPNAEFKVPTVEKTSTLEPTTNVSYSVTTKDLRALAAALDDPAMSNREVGLRSFRYTFEDHVDED